MIPFMSAEVAFARYGPTRKEHLDYMNFAEKYADYVVAYEKFHTKPVGGVDPLDVFRGSAVEGLNVGRFQPHKGAQG